MDELLAVGLILILFGALGGWFIFYYPVSYVTQAPDGSQVFILCNGSVCQEPLERLRDGLPAHGIGVHNRTEAIIRVVNGSTTKNATTTATTLPDGTTVTIIGGGGGSGGGSGSKPREVLPQPEPAPGDSSVNALSVVVEPKPGQRVEVIVGGRTYYAEFDQNGKVVSTNIVDLPGPFATVSENARAAIITYVAAPFIAGFVFTVSAFAAGRVGRRIR